MRHRSASSNFSRHPDHRRAMLRNMVLNLIEHGRVRTTIQKAKAARPLAEKIITLGKKGSLHHRQLATSELGSTVAAKAAVRKVFSDLKDRFANRSGGYTRILRLPRTIRQAKADLPRGQNVNRSKFYGTRLGDDATMVLWEFCEAEIAKRTKGAKKRPSKQPKPKPAPAAPAVPAESAASQAQAPEAQPPAPPPPPATSTPTAG